MCGSSKQRLLAVAADNGAQHWQRGTTAEVEGDVRVQRRQLAVAGEDNKGTGGDGKVEIFLFIETKCLCWQEAEETAGIISKLTNVHVPRNECY
jgi:hypothetical protein